MLKMYMAYIAPEIALIETIKNWSKKDTLKQQGINSVRAMQSTVCVLLKKKNHHSSLFLRVLTLKIIRAHPFLWVI